MITLNLIPESIRKENQLRHVYRLNVGLAKLVVCFAIAIASLSFIVKVMLSNTYNQAEEELTFISKNAEPYNQKIRELNTKVNIISQVTDGPRDWDKLIVKIGNMLPAGITLSYLKIDQTTQTIQLSGQAATRDDLISFKSLINSSGYIKEVDIPIGSLLAKNNIPFSFSSKINFETGK